MSTFGIRRGEDLGPSTLLPEFTSVLLLLIFRFYQYYFSSFAFFYKKTEFTLSNDIYCETSKVKGEMSPSTPNAGRIFCFSFHVSHLTSHFDGAVRLAGLGYEKKLLQIRLYDILDGGGPAHVGYCHGVQRQLF